jgi:hypothetical protein
MVAGLVVLSFSAVLPVTLNAGRRATRAIRRRVRGPGFYGNFVSNAFAPEAYPDQAERGDDLVGIDPFALAAGWPLFSGLSFIGFPS